MDERKHQVNFEKNSRTKSPSIICNKVKTLRDLSRIDVIQRRWIVLVVVWASYLVWEYFVQQWSAKEQTAVIRVDLIIIIPVLTLSTIILLYKIFKKR